MTESEWREQHQGHGGIAASILPVHGLTLLGWPIISHGVSLPYPVRKLYCVCKSEIEFRETEKIKCQKQNRKRKH